MDIRAEKLANARKKLRDHQVKKTVNLVQPSEKQQQTTEKPTPEIENPQKANYYEIPEGQFSAEGIQPNIGASTQNKSIDNLPVQNPEVNVTEILIANNANLEMQIKNFTEKLAHLEYLYGSEVSSHNTSKQRIINLESELSDLSSRYLKVEQDMQQKNREFNDLQVLYNSFVEANNNLSEQVEFTKSMLTAKESENTHLQSQINNYHNQLDSAMLQIQQLTNNSSIMQAPTNNSVEEIELLKKKISALEQQTVVLQKERDNKNSHYEHYVKELTEQLKNEVNKNESHLQTIQNLYNRENSLIEQISDMEIRLQNYQKRIENEVIKVEHVDNSQELQDKYNDIKKQLEDTKLKLSNLQEEYAKSIETIQELSASKEVVCDHDNISISKLNADIASDKLAAQRATEQNRKLKQDVENLEQVVVKINKDKLELTEKLTHEKQLNKDIVLKLAEVEENAKNMTKLLKAKDSEMIRLQNNNREIEKKYEDILQDMNHMKHVTSVEHNHEAVGEISNNNCYNEETSLIPAHNCMETSNEIAELDIKHEQKFIPKEDAMVKLQERFLNIMDEVANLSDEKHRLEHIILQLQNETETICEYVALYQQQRSLLKKREEERSNQLKIFQSECDLLKSHLEALRELLLRLAADEELDSYLKDEARFNDIIRVKDLLEKLQNCSLINPKYNTLDLNIFYPCNCCSGQLITI
ncbi:golgin-80 [Danaus plexippus plexippus]|uniref:Golgin-80 n=1 Tax=Danaus plexippus plexippus TaxID=278856 RepID=A0A212ETU1_DANPL|nr:golgin-80 [Danaus plexippus plexippus]